MVPSRRLLALAASASLLFAPGADAAVSSLEGTPVPAGSIDSLSTPRAGGPGAGTPRAIPFRTRDPGRRYSARDRSATHGGGRSAPSGPAPLADAISPLNQPGLSAASTTPPDSTGAIGPSHYIEMVNRQVAVYSRAALALSGQIDLDNFVGKPSDRQCDPQVVWDEPAQRWVYAALDCDGGSQNFLLFGWSKTASPIPLPSSSSAGNWCRFQQATGSELDDYPKLGTNAGHAIVGTNVFAASGAFLTSRIWTYEKPPPGETSCSMPAGFSFGSAAGPLLTADLDEAFTPVPANTADGGPAGYVVAADYPETGPANQLMVWHLEGGGSGGVPTLVGDGNVAVAAFDFPSFVPQPGSNRVLDSLDTRLTQAVAVGDPDAGGAKGVWTQHTIDGPGTPSQVRWYELVPSRCADGTCPTATVEQAGTVSDPTHFAFNAAISPTWSGRSALVQYNLGSGSLLAQIRAQWHSPDLAAGTTTGNLLVGSSSNADQDFSCRPGPCRWGDYAGATPDPVATDTVWSSNQLLGPTSGTNPHWTTRNFSIRIFGGYARPTAASPLRVSLVPAYSVCAGANRTHGPPLAFGSCAPPVQTSALLTVGTADANGEPANAVGFLRLGVVTGDPSTPADEADVRVTMSLADVRQQGALDDYTGELRLSLRARLTDRANGSSADEPGTVSDLTFPVPAPCGATPAGVGATCDVTTTLDAVLPGSVPEGARSIWALEDVRVMDGGADGIASTEPNTLFARQGVFVP
ncbi:MAG: hypothetical protein ACRDLQ_01565 [Solirubrobacterales bacterium]